MQQNLKDKNIKVCLLTNALTPDTGYGINRYSFELISHIRKNFNLTVLSQDNPANTLYWGMKEVFLPFKVLPVRADVYHAVSPQLAKTAILLRKSPLITTIHDLIPFTKSLTSFYHKQLSFNSWIRLEYIKLCTYVAIKSDRIIVPFEITRKDLILMLGVNPNKIRVISYGVNTNFFKPIHLSEEFLKKKRRKKIIFYVGGFSQAKGADVLMEAFQYVLKKYANVELWISGKWIFFNGIELAKKLNIQNCIRFLGHIPEKRLSLYYNLADLVVLPYRIGFSFPMLEGMACGKAVITSDTPDIKEIVGDAVLSIPPSDVEKLAESIYYLLTNNSVREELAFKAYCRAKRLSWDEIAKKTMDIYLEVI